MVALLAAVPLITASNVVLNFLVVALLTALVGQGWNLLGGYGGQYSFGHAAFFGTGAYATAILQVRYGVNAWLGFAIGIAAGAAVGAFIGVLILLHFLPILRPASKLNYSLARKGKPKTCC